MPDPPDIDDLRRRKSRNVGQQVAVTQADIRREASWWRNNPVTPAIRDAITQRGLDVDAGILINVCDREFGLDDCADGTFVTNAGRFIEFSIELSADGKQLVAIHDFRDITDSLDIVDGNPALGLHVRSSCLRYCANSTPMLADNKVFTLGLRHTLALWQRAMALLQFS